MTSHKLLPFQSLPAADDVGAALNLLRDALAEEAQRINDEGAKAMKAGDYSTAEGVLDFAKRLLAFRSRVEGLGLEWSELEGLRDTSSTAVQEIVSKRFFGRRASGEITPHLDYCRPLLEVLVEIGGTAKTKEALDRLGEKMKGILKPKDYECHESKGKQIRWRNAAQWARNHMVNEDGRMKKGSPNGIWEISDSGRIWLKKTKNHDGK
jgi:restriction system protein